MNSNNNNDVNNNNNNDKLLYQPYHPNANPPYHNDSIPVSLIKLKHSKILSQNIESLFNNNIHTNIKNNNTICLNNHINK